MSKLSQFHYGIGVSFFVIFLLTGFYMFVEFPLLYAEREEVRMMYRATHIYLLMSALINLMAGNYLRRYAPEFSQKLAYVASIMLLLAPPMFFAAFLIEPQDYLIGRPISFWGVVALVGGVGLHSLSEMPCLQKLIKR